GLGFVRLLPRTKEPITNPEARNGRGVFLCHNVPQHTHSPHPSIEGMVGASRADQGSAFRNFEVIIHLKQLPAKDTAHHE
ncbi:MAG: hypothetical protein ACOY3P_02135, partial [Planctomycetota bacterium]